MRLIPYTRFSLLLILFTTCVSVQGAGPSEESASIALGERSSSSEDSSTLLSREREAMLLAAVEPGGFSSDVPWAEDKHQFKNVEAWGILEAMTLFDRPPEDLSGSFLQQGFDSAKKGENTHPSDKAWVLKLRDAGRRNTGIPVQPTIVKIQYVKQSPVDKAEISAETIEGSMEGETTMEESAIESRDDQERSQRMRAEILASEGFQLLLLRHVMQGLNLPFIQHVSTVHYNAAGIVFSTQPCVKGVSFLKHMVDFFQKYWAKNPPEYTIERFCSVLTAVAETIATLHARTALQFHSNHEQGTWHPSVVRCVTHGDFHGNNIMIHEDANHGINVTLIDCASMTVSFAEHTHPLKDLVYFFELIFKEGYGFYRYLNPQKWGENQRQTFIRLFLSKYHAMYENQLRQELDEDFTLNNSAIKSDISNLRDAWLSYVVGNSHAYFPFFQQYLSFIGDAHETRIPDDVWRTALPIRPMTSVSYNERNPYKQSAEQPVTKPGILAPSQNNARPGKEHFPQQDRQAA